MGDLVIVDDDDERLVLTATGAFRAEVVPEEGDGAWRSLSGPDELVEFYDPTDVFGDLADALAEAFPSVAPEDASDADEDDDGTADEDDDGTADEDADDTEGADDDDADGTADETDDPAASGDQATEGRPTA